MIRPTASITARPHVVMVNVELDGTPAPDAKAAALLTPEARARLAGLAEFLSALPDWTRADLEHWLRDHADARGMKLKEVALPLRVALTGSTTAPPIDVTLDALGRGGALARMPATAPPRA